MLSTHTSPRPTAVVLLPVLVMLMQAMYAICSIYVLKNTSLPGLFGAADRLEWGRHNFPKSSSTGLAARMLVRSGAMHNIISWKNTQVFSNDVAVLLVY